MLSLKRTMKSLGRTLFVLLKIMELVRVISSKDCKIEGDVWKFDCFPQGRASQIDCEGRGCCWHVSDKKESDSDLQAPACFYPVDFSSYIITDAIELSDGAQLNMSLHHQSPYPRDIRNLTMKLKFLSQKVLSIKILDSNNKRWEPLLVSGKDHQPPEETRHFSRKTKVKQDGAFLINAEADYYVRLPGVGQPFGFQVFRQTGDFLLKTVGGFIYSDQMLQMSSLLPSSVMYGLGEHRQGLRLNTSQWSTVTLWNRDHPPLGFMSCQSLPLEVGTLRSPFGWTGLKSINQLEVDNPKINGERTRGGKTRQMLQLSNLQVLRLENTNLYGSHPVYLCKDGGGWHAVYLHNSNAMDVILQPTPAITWRPIGGILHFYVVVGADPVEVMTHYTALIGRSFMPPYWSLGFHLCSQNYGTASNTLDTVDRMRGLGIPQDTQWNDIDYADENKVFTTGFKKFGNQTKLAQDIHKRGLHYVIMVDCGICSATKPGTYAPYDLGKEMGIFINGSDGKPLVGRVWPGHTVWPDFISTPDLTWRYWFKIAADFHNKVPFDGMWLDMNEISNFVDGSIHGCNNSSRFNSPPYLPGVSGGSLYKHTICPSARHGMLRHYDVHSLYGREQSAMSNMVLLLIRLRRPFLISRSTFPGQGHFGGHWSGDNSATFYDMHKSIPAMLHANMYGIPMTGSDICGFHGNTSRELCLRWHQLGSFYGFSRNHNAEDCLPQDPGQFDEEFIAVTRRALLTRYTLLPYLYTLYWNSHFKGEPVARPLVFEFPDDPMTYDLDTQFLWGPALMISPVLTEGATEISVYIPAGIWYYFYDGRNFTASASTGHVVNFNASLDINLHVRGGHVIVTQAPAQTTTLSRKNPFCLVVALSMTNYTATGDLYWDNGDSLNSYDGNYNFIRFSATNTSVKSNIDHLGFLVEPMILSNVTVLGVKHPPTHVQLNGKDVDFSYSERLLFIPNLDVQLTKRFSIIWF